MSDTPYFNAYEENKRATNLNTTSVDIPESRITVRDYTSTVSFSYNSVPSYSPFRLQKNYVVVKSSEGQDVTVVKDVFLEMLDPYTQSWKTVML